jgi:hypothetical protein
MISQPAPVAPPPTLGPNDIAKMVMDDLLVESKRFADVPLQLAGLDFRRYRYFSFHAVPKDKLEMWRRLFNVILHQMSGQSNAIVLSQEVAGSGGLLVRIDIDDYDWNAAAWRTVAAREPYFREPLINAAVAAIIRDLIGETSDVRNFHVFGVVRADWFIREAIETSRSPSYYDLLYAIHRFPVGGKVAVEKVPALTATKKIKQKESVPWKGGVWPEDGKFYPAGAFPVYTGREIEIEVPAQSIVVAQADQKAIDIPKDKADWDKLWGNDKLEDFLKQSGKRVKHGAIAMGMGDDPKLGSYVARNNRLLTFAPSLSCVGGASLESYDVIDPVGERDYVQNAPNLARGKIVFDAQELLISMPNGFQACQLNANDKRVDVADPQVAIDEQIEAKAKYLGLQRKIDARVRSPGSCFICHGSVYGVIDAGRLVRDMFGGNLRNPLIIPNNRLDRDFKGFYLDWEDKILGMQTPYKIALKKASAWKAPAKEWVGLDFSNATFDARVWYDRPLDLAQVLLENGLTPKQYEAIVEASKKSVWIPAVLTGMAIPRRAYEVDVAPEIAKLAALTGAVPLIKVEKKEK